MRCPSLRTHLELHFHSSFWSRGERPGLVPGCQELGRPCRPSLAAPSHPPQRNPVHLFPHQLGVRLRRAQEGWCSPGPGSCAGDDAVGTAQGGCRALNSPRGERRLVGARRAPAGLAFSVPCGQGPGSLSQKRRRRLQGTSGHVGTDRAQCPWWPMPGQHSPWYPRAQNKNLECGPPTPRGLAPDPQAWGPVASGCGSASPSLGAGLRCPVG